MKYQNIVSSHVKNMYKFVQLNKVFVQKSCLACLYLHENVYVNVRETLNKLCL